MSDELHARIDALERRHQRLARGIWGAAVVLTVGLGTRFAADSQEPDVLRAG